MADPRAGRGAARLQGILDDRARRAFQTLALTGLRRSELLGLRWRHVNLVEGTLRVVESKSEEGERLIGLSPALVDAWAEQFTSSPYRSDDDYVFCHPRRGSQLEREWYAAEFRAALAEAGITDNVRPFHDMRHTALTNLAATGASPIACWRPRGIAPCRRRRATCIWPAWCSVMTLPRSSAGCSG